MSLFFTQVRFTFVKKKVKVNQIIKQVHADIVDTWAQTHTHTGNLYAYVSDIM